MARSDLLKRLFRNFQREDRPAFVETAQEIIDEERKKHHTVLAKELQEILEGHGALNGTVAIPHLQPLPKDKDRGCDLVEILRPERYLDDLIHSAQQKRTLYSIGEEFKNWDVLEANGLRPSSRLLFCGPPGCGKTATAEAVANAVGVPLLTVRFDAVVSSLLGETAANLRKVFDFAGQGTWVVLFDEFDAIGRSRDDATEHGELKRVVNAFLQMLDRFTGRSLIIAATNFEQSLDPALWRRFDEVVRFQQPDDCQIEKLARLRCAAWLKKNLNLDFVVQQLTGSSHAEIERVCLDAVKQAVMAGRRLLDESDWGYGLERHRERRQVMESLKTDRPPEVDSE